MTRTERATARFQWYGGELNMNYTGGEDMIADLEAETPEAHRFMVLTANGDHVYAAFTKTPSRARRRAARHIVDDIHAERPVAIVDLDTGREWFPSSATVEWKSGGVRS